MKKLYLLLFAVLIASPLGKAYAQSAIIIEPTVVASESADASKSAQEDTLVDKDVTKPEEPEEKREVFELFTNRPADELTAFNGVAYALQTIVKSGVPANTVVLILLLPVLATVIVFFRYVIGLPTIGLLVPIALSITLLATGIVTGLLLLSTIVFGSLFSRVILKRIRIMQLPKIAISIFFVSILILGLVSVRAGGLISVNQLSIFPVLLMIILSEQIVALQLERSFRETITITVVTLFLGMAGFFLLSFVFLRNFVLLYPEVILLVIPVNILIGRYFGLRINEYFRFSHIRNAAK